MTLERVKTGVDYSSAFETADGLDLDGELIYWKDSLQEVETGAVVSVGRLYAEKERSCTPTLRQEQPKHTRRPRGPQVRQALQRKLKERIDGTIQCMGTRKAYIDNTGKVNLTNSVRSIYKDEICLTGIYPKQRTELLIHISIKAMTKRRTLWSYRARGNYPLKLRVA